MEATTRGGGTRHLPSALDRLPEIMARLPEGIFAVFLDYDGTLTPIVRHPALAVMDDAMRAAVRAVAARWPVAVVSGRDLDDVRRMVGLDGVSYAGSHGFDILAANGSRYRRGSDHDEALAAAAAQLEEAVRPVPGAWVEPKRFAIAVHTREVDDTLLPHVDQLVQTVSDRHPELRRTGGKRVHELRPAIDWDKGKALLALLEALGLDRADVVPLYLGDDETDEDAFIAIRGRGIGIVVGAPDRPTAATYTLAGPGEVRAFLEALAAGTRERP